MTITVVGSINNDIVAMVDKFPERGDTIFGKSIEYFPGGKGANQATTVAKLGRDVQLVGSVGDDQYGEQLLNILQTNGVDVTYVKKSEKLATGTAIVAIDATSENTMFVMKGANEDLTVNDIENAFNKEKETEVLLVQMEIPQETAIKSMQLAKRQGVYTILDPAPAEGITVEALEYADIITPNQQETHHMLGVEVVDVESAVEAGKLFEGMGVKNSIIKMAEKGLVVYQSGDWVHIPGIEVDAVDSVGAGDAFAGALACCIADGITLTEAARFASIVGSLKVTKPGAQVGIPSAEEVKAFCKDLNVDYCLDKKSSKGVI